MRIHIYRRKGESPYWHAQVYAGAKRYRFSCLTEDKTTAREYARQRLEELKARHDRGLIGLPERVRVSEVLNRYEDEGVPKLRPASQRRTLGIVTQVRAWFVGGPLHDPVVTNVRPDDIAAFLEQKRNEGVCARTVNLCRATFTPHLPALPPTVAAHPKQSGECDRNPARRATRTAPTYE